MANQHIELEDAGRRVEKSKRVLRTTTLNHFKKYLEFTNSDYQNLDQIPENHMKDELLGKFSTYLKEHVDSVKQYTTHKNYVSSFHQLIVEKFPSKKSEFETYYKNLLSTILSQYTASVVSENSASVNLINHHTPIRTSDREYVSKVLFRRMIMLLVVG